MERTVDKLLACETGADRPGILLGKIQSGKTRAFIGVMALAFDRDYDIAIILTKGTKALARQTYERLRKDFCKFLESDQVKIVDVMHLPQNFRKFELQQKLIIVVKKETNNLKRIIRALTETYPDLSSRRLLIVDDEADYASVGFRHTEEEGLQLNKIPRQINDLRGRVARSDYLQVTATPYSLYLQPEELKLPTSIVPFKPTRPVFTVVLPEFHGYVGGNFYFVESENPESFAANVYEEISGDELSILRSEDKRSFRIDECLESPKIEVLRRAVVNFLVGAATARLVSKRHGENPKKYSFIVHTEHGRASHAWQERIVRALVSSLELAVSDPKTRPILNRLIGFSYSDIRNSVGKSNEVMPLLSEVEGEVLNALAQEFVVVTKVNSETEAEQLLDRDGQLELRTPLNIFIGGQILDRGVTIDNLIGFYYGRRPQRYQQDTVLQHSRMYGNRPTSDLAVTRFYTALPIYQAMKRIDEFDAALRERLERDPDNAEIVFIRKDPTDRIIPCSPNKILPSRVTTLLPFKRLLPIGFQTKAKSTSAAVLSALDSLVRDCQPKDDENEPFLIDLHVAKLMISEITKMFESTDGFEWDEKAFKAAMEYLTPVDKDRMAKLWCLVRTHRRAKRLRKDGSYERFFNAPDTAHVEGAIARETATDRPMLMLFRFDGSKEDGWAGSPFWWPVLTAPANTKTVIFASETVD
jgi:Z1 domain-containing protein/RAD3-like DEAD/DEAH box helicase